MGLGENDTYCDTPKPETVAVCGELAASSLNVRVSEYARVAVGVNDTPMVQLFPAATVEFAHVLFVVLITLTLPPGFTTPMWSAALPVLFSVTVPVLVAPTLTLPRFRSLTLTTGAGAAVAVPLRSETSTGLALSIPRTS